MSTAQQLFVAYGTIIATHGILLGVPLAAARQKQPAASRHLVNAHLEALMQGPLHLGLAFAIGITAFDSGLATLAAVLLVIGSAVGAIGDLLNWLMGTGDQFAERSPGFLFNAASGPLIVVGAVIVTIGVLSGL